MQIETIEILLVEDNPAQVRLTKEAFKEGRLTTKLQVVYDGEAAVEYLKRQGPFNDRSLPGLVLLDWNLPKKNGAEVLLEIRNDPDLKQIPVFVLSSSGHQADIDRAYELGVDSYIKKPQQFEEFIRIVQEIENYCASAGQKS